MIRDTDGFRFSGPGRHGCDDEAERLFADVAKLKMSASWNRQGCPRPNGDSFRVFAKFAPNLAFAVEEEPNFFNRFVLHSL